MSKLTSLRNNKFNQYMYYITRFVLSYNIKTINLRIWYKNSFYNLQVLPSTGTSDNKVELSYFFVDDYNKLR